MPAILSSIVRIDVPTILRAIAGLLASTAAAAFSGAPKNVVAPSMPKG
jgi:hypothetical protein